MGFNAVYKSLQEIFPQIDARLLRAVAIEHPKDPDAAAGIIINEIIPLLSERSKLPGSAPNDSINTDETQMPCCQMQNNYLYVGSSSMPEFVGAVNAIGPVNQRGLPNDDSNGAVNASTVYDCSELNHANSNKLPPFVKGEDTYLVTGSSKLFIGESSSLMNEAGDSVFQEETNVDVGPEGQLSDLNSIELNYRAVHGQKDNFDVEEVPKDRDLIDYRNVPHLLLGHAQKNDFDINLFPDEGRDFDGSAPKKRDLTTFRNVPENDSSVLDVNSTFQPLQVDEGHLPNSEERLVPERECYSSTSVDGTSSKHGCSGDGDADLESDSESNLVSRSNKVFKIAMLEEMINESKTNKKMLFSSMVSLMNLTKEVELKEKAAEEAKMEAAMAGSDILSRVEELKEMLVQAKEANEMHAGEIYGEKAILATEMRELQSRLISLADERDKSLTVLDEMRQTLEARLAAAEELRNEAEQEKLRKEDIAQDALAKQEAIMETIVQESNRLHQEAEENAKLRDFLIDRGHLVDMLQGEISVICQDVRLLKEKFDANLPLSKSFTSAQTTCALASSGSSVRSVASDQIADQSLLAETLKKRNPSSSMDSLSPKSKQIAEGTETDSKSPEMSPMSSMNGLSPSCGLEAETVTKDPKYIVYDGLESWDILDKDRELAV